jgi:predicted DNA-binding transcriptional regulator
MGIFKQIGLNFDRSNNKLQLDFDKYSGKTSGNYLQNFSVQEQMKIIEMYLKIEGLRYANQQIYEKSKGHEKLYHILYVVAMALNIVIPYLPDLVGYANTQFEQYSVYFAGASAIITFISYFFTRTLMSTVGNKTNFEQMQQALTKLRFTVETVIMGSYVLDGSEKLQDSPKNFHLNTFSNSVMKDLDSIYQFNKAFKDNDIAKRWLDVASSETEKILTVFETEITKAVDKINKIKSDLTVSPLVSTIQQIALDLMGNSSQPIEFIIPVTNTKVEIDHGTRTQSNV